jgi:hypothetical protein
MKNNHFLRLCSFKHILRRGEKDSCFTTKHPTTTKDESPKLELAWNIMYVHVLIFASSHFVLWIVDLCNALLWLGVQKLYMNLKINTIFFSLPFLTLMRVSANLSLEKIQQSKLKKSKCREKCNVQQAKWNESHSRNGWIWGIKRFRTLNVEWTEPSWIDL